MGHESYMMGTRDVKAGIMPSAHFSVTTHAHVTDVLT